MITIKEYFALLNAQIILMKQLGHGSLTIDDILLNFEQYLSEQDIKKYSIKSIEGFEQMTQLRSKQDKMNELQSRMEIL